MKRSKHYQYLQEFQALRLERDYSHLGQQRQYAILADFFFNEMYGPKDFQARDTQARRLHQFVHLAPGLSMRDIEVTLDLLDLTVQLDHELAEVLTKMNVPIPFDEAMYEEAYFRADAYQPRVKQIDLIGESLRRVHRLSQIPLLGTALNNTKTVAKLMGMGELHRFLRKGYAALMVVDTLEPFLVEVSTKELERLNRIYGVSSP
jgi:hypothetical protein